MKRILQLVLETEPFDQILAGVKVKEYRGLTDYWKTRLEGREYDVIRFRNGYLSDAKEMQVRFLGTRKNTKRGRYEIKLGKILKTRNLRRKG